MARIVATYWLETPLTLEQAAEAIAGEQSSGTFTPLPGETAALRARARAHVERVTLHDTVDAPSLPGALPGAAGRYQQGEVVISFPLDNIGTNLPTLLATVAGNLFELRELSGVRLERLVLPEVFAAAHPGPQFGILGTRRLAGVTGRPILGTIIKPSVGLTPDETAEMVATVAAAGLDFVKDDELMANPPYAPLTERVAAVMRVVNDHADKHGKKVMVAFNISDELDAMLRHHDAVVAAGGSCVMVSLNAVGLVGVAKLRQHSQLPIHGHRNGWGMLTRAPQLGLSFDVYQTLWRLVGVDQLHVNGLANKFWEADDSVITSLRACLTPLWGGREVMPVVSSGQSARQAPATYRQGGTVDLIYLAGGGLMAHPDGPAAGVTALQEAWRAALAGVPLARHAADHPALAKALATFGDEL